MAREGLYRWGLNGRNAVDGIRYELYSDSTQRAEEFRTSDFFWSYAQDGSAMTIQGITFSGVNDSVNELRVSFRFSGDAQYYEVFRKGGFSLSPDGANVNLSEITLTPSAGSGLVVMSFDGMVNSGSSGLTLYFEYQEGTTVIDDVVIPSDAGSENTQFQVLGSGADAKYTRGSLPTLTNNTSSQVWNIDHYRIRVTSNSVTTRQTLARTSTNIDSIGPNGTITINSAELEWDVT